MQLLTSAMRRLAFQNDCGTLCFYGLMDLEMPIYGPRQGAGKARE